MKKTLGLLLPLILIAIASMACGGISSRRKTVQTTRPAQTTPDLQATIDEAVVSTCGAQAGLQATLISLNATATAIAFAELQAVPTPLPTEALSEMAEDKLETLIAERVQMATKAAGLAADKSLEAIKDGTISAKEQEILYTYWYYSNEVIAYADEVIAAYFARYADLASATMPPLREANGDLKAISEQVQVVLPLLEQIGQALEQGKGQKDKVLRQVETAAETVQTLIDDTQGLVQAWTASLPYATQQRVSRALAVKPKSVAKNRKAAINKANYYAKSVQTAIADQKITQAEMTRIAQFGANAAASLTRKGGADLAGLAGSVNDITAQIAAGKLPSAREELTGFQSALSGNP